MTDTNANLESTNASLTVQQRRNDEWDCSQTLQRFYLTLDTQAYDDCAALFAEDGCWNRLGKLLEGRATIRAALDQRPQKLAILHQLTNVVADIHDATHASTRAYVTTYTHVFNDVSAVVKPAPLRAPFGIWRLETRMVKQQDRWLIAFHTMDHLFTAKT